MQRLSINEANYHYDAEDPPGFRAGMARLGRALGARELGASVYELPPGEAICPYHYEHGEEEIAFVLDGQPTLRTPEGETRLAVGDVVYFSTGPAGAHAVRNDGTATARVLMVSTVRFPNATVYPDSDKVAIWTREGDDDLIVRRESGVGYWLGETAAGTDGG